MLYYFSYMQDKPLGIDRDREFDRKIKYWNLLITKWKIEDQLNHEYPDEMYESRKKLAQIMLAHGLIKCEHEK